jgi:hypothetical protein
VPDPVHLPRLLRLGSEWGGEKADDQQYRDEGA